MVFRELFHRSKGDSPKGSPKEKSASPEVPKRSRSISRTRLRKRDSLPPMPHESRQSLPYEEAQQSRPPQMGSTPLMANGRTSRETQRPNQKRFSSPVQSDPYSNGPSYQWPLPAQDSQNVPKTPDLPAEFQRMNLGSDQQSLPRETNRTPKSNNVARQPLSDRIDPYVDHDSDADVFYDSNAQSSEYPPAPSKANWLPHDQTRQHVSRPSNGSAYTKNEPELAGHTRHGSVSRKPLGDDAQVANLRGVSGNATHEPRDSDHTLKREPAEPDLAAVSHASSYDHPLPSLPRNQSTYKEPTQANRDNTYNQDEYNPYIVHDHPTAPSLEGIVDLTNTVDTTVHEKWAPAVTKETIHEHHHHIREEVITREIHTHDVHHRILPIIDVQVLPTRHFIPHPTDPEQQIEIDEADIPGRAGSKSDWVIAETVSKLGNGAAPTLNGNTVGGGFSARKFTGQEGDEKHWTEGGMEKSQRTWIHPPVMQEGAMLTGQSVPFHFGSKDAELDGIRADLS